MQHFGLSDSSIHLLQGGTIGELTRLDTMNPILYLDFPQVSAPQPAPAAAVDSSGLGIASANPRRQGRIKLFGTLVFPKSKLTTIKGKPLARAGSGASYPAPHRILHDVAEAKRPHGSAYVYRLPHARSDRPHAVAGRCAVDGCGIAAKHVDENFQNFREPTY